MIISPKNIIESLLTANNKSIIFRLWENRLQKLLFIFSLVTLLSGGIAAIATHFYQTTWLPWVGLGSLILCQIGALLYQLSVVIPSLKVLKNSEQSLVLPATEKFNEDIDRITNLSRDFDQHHLDYARDRLTMVGDQLRQRIAFMVGAIDKVGILPSAVAGFFYAKDILDKPQFKSSGVEWIFFTLVCFYLLTSHLVFVSQRLDQLTLILKHAAAKKERDTVVQK